MNIRYERKALQLLQPRSGDIGDYKRPRYVGDPYEQDLTIEVKIDGVKQQGCVIAIGFDDMIISWAEGEYGDTYYACLQIYTGQQDQVLCIASDGTKVFEDAMLLYGRELWRGDCIETHVVERLFEPAL